ncbi:MAG: IS200/IS605 family transposase [Holosporales bacterium]|jgi:putative transposase|nr:IS200/IS605 family transposase [Holosporales bacterium]
MNVKERYAKGAHMTLDLQYHFVWKTKYFYEVLCGDIALRLRDLIREICALQGMNVIKGNIRFNRVHVLVKAPSHMSSSRMAQYLKRCTAHALLREFSELRKKYWGCHLWGRGYFCSTVGAVTEDIIKKYIEDQNDEVFSFKIRDEKKDLSSLGVSSDT